VDEIFGKLNELADSGNEFLKEARSFLSENKGNVKGTLERIHKVSGEVEEFVDVLNADLVKICDRIDSVIGNVDAVVKNSSPDVERMVSDLCRITTSLKEFSRIIVERPEALVRGRIPAGRE
jgi:hypothetical protein